MAVCNSRKTNLMNHKLLFVFSKWPDFQKFFFLAAPIVLSLLMSLVSL